jgi:hypothetical protein
MERVGTEDLREFEVWKAWRNGRLELRAEVEWTEEEVLELLLKHQAAYRSSVRRSSPLDWSFDIVEWFGTHKKRN